MKEKQLIGGVVHLRCGRFASRRVAQLDAATIPRIRRALSLNLYPAFARKNLA